MKSFQIGFSVVASCLLSACQSNSTSPAATSMRVAKARGLQRLEGTWVSIGTSGFTIVKIQADSTGTYTSCSDRKMSLGINSADRYYLYESPIRVSHQPTGFHQPLVAIHTKDVRFDYYLDGDTLIEYDKMGLQGTLVRMKPTK